MSRHLLAGLLGAAVALAAVAVHRLSWAAVPWGLVLAGVASLATALWWRTSARPRTAATFAAGWFVVLVLALTPRPEGDYAVASDAMGYGLIGIGVAVAAVGLTSLTVRNRV